MSADPIRAPLDAAANVLLERFGGDVYWLSEEEDLTNARKDAVLFIVAFLRAVPEEWEPRGCPIPGACSATRALADAVEKAATRNPCGQGADAAAGGSSCCKAEGEREVSENEAARLGWPGEPGVPLNPKLAHHKQHWIQLIPGEEPLACQWSWVLGDRHWCVSDNGWLTIDELFSQWPEARYLGICLTPAEVAQREAEQAVAFNKSKFAERFGEPQPLETVPWDGRDFLYWSHGKWRIGSLHPGLTKLDPSIVVWMPLPDDPPL